MWYHPLHCGSLFCVVRINTVILDQESKSIMTDSSLDDFFAKKDKSKKKTKSKLSSTDVLAKPDETPRKAKKKKDKEQPGGPGLSSVPQGTLKKEEEDEEWKDFEEEKKVDYSGLRIQTLQISKDEEEREGGESDEDDGEEGDDRREGASGPWNKSAAPGTPSNASAFSQESEDKKEGAAGKKYVPPAQRTATPANPPRRKKEAPNISSEIDFPSLGGYQPPTASAWGSKSKFETSGTGDVETNPDHRRGVNLTLENKFSALQD